VGGTHPVDVLGNRLGADERDGLYAGVFQDGVHSIVRPVDDVEDALGNPGLGEQLPQALRTKRRALGGLEDVGVARPDGYGQGPQRDHAREVERGDGGDHAERESVGAVVYAPGNVPDVLAHHEGGHPTGELHHLYAAPDLSSGVLGVLTVLKRYEVPEFLEVLI
jgi:hypothetical protein